MDEAFYIGNHPASEFGAELLASYSVSGSAITRTRVVSRTGSHITPCAVQYGLRTISLPVDIYGDTTEDAAAKRSALTAVLLDGPVELYLPDGCIYTAQLDSSGQAVPWDDDGCLLSCTYTLSGYRHGPLETVPLHYGSTWRMPFFAAGTAPEMECRLVCTIADYTPDVPDLPDTQADDSTEVQTATVHYPDGGACTVQGVQLGDTITVDGIEKQVLINGQPAFQNVTAISGWPTVRPGAGSVESRMNEELYFYASPCALEYYPIFV